MQFKENSMSTATLLSLPLELLHRIFDDVDARTLFSVREVCRMLYAAVNSYNRFHLIIENDSKSYLKCLARFIPSESIVSIMFHDIHSQYRYCYWYNNSRHENDLTRLFRSCFKDHLFTRLRSLIFTKIYDTDIESLIPYQSIHSLELVSIDLCEEKASCTINYINAIIAQDCLRKLSFNNADLILDHILYPNHCSLDQLIIDICTYEQYMIVIDNLPNLKLFKIGLLHFNQLRSNISSLHSTRTSSLKSLIINRCSLPFEHIRSLVTRTTELSHLKLISRERTEFDRIFDGYHWEELIRNQLPQLTRFEYFFSFVDKKDICFGMFSSLIASFQTSFWLKEKHWFTICGYNFESQIFELHTKTISAIMPTYSIKLEQLAEDDTYHLVGEPLQKYWWKNVTYTYRIHSYLNVSPFNRNSSN